MSDLKLEQASLTNRIQFIQQLVGILFKDFLAALIKKHF